MADKNIGVLPAVPIGDLPTIADLYDDTLLPVEQQGEARRMSGAQWKKYARASVAAQETAAREAAAAAAQSAQTAAGHARKAEGSADAASGSASTSSSEALKAQAARKAIENMSVSAEALPPGSEASVSKTVLQDGAVALKFGVPQGIRGPKGDTGSGILKIERTYGTGAPGTVDTYTITLTDGSATVFRVYNGADGKGIGDMLKEIYDPQNRAKDIFACIDSKQDTLHPITSAEIDEIWGEEGG